MKEMVECCGGQYITKSTKLADDVIVISCDEDAKDHGKFAKNVICSNELLLTGILKQQLDVEQYRLNAGQQPSTANDGKRKRASVATASNGKKSKKK
ncbi:PAX-interacting protein 1-like [Clytia hemisphaerica]|uniref:PAX-interacting protein 1-like n=1 Tax=Clytia hemisphaerica TaxID=252671 RepID=UPI0034D6BCC2